MAFQIDQPYEGVEYKQREIPEPDLMKEQYWSKRHVLRALNLSEMSFEQLAKRGSIIVSSSGKISDFSLRHLTVLLPHLMRRYDLVCNVKKELGLENYNQAIEAGRLKVETALGIEVISRDELKKALLSEPIFSSEEVAKIFSVHKATVPRWINSGRLKEVKFKGNWYVFRDSVLELALELNSATACQKTRVRACAQKIIERKKGEAKRLRRNTVRRIGKTLGKDKILEKDIQFAIFHQYGCSGNQLQEHVKDSYGGNISEALRNGRLEGEKDGDQWHIPFPSMIWAISSIRNWVRFSKVAQNQVSFDTFVAYTKKDEFGEVIINLSGHFSIRKEMAAKANEICAEVKERKLNEKRKIMSAMRQRQLANRDSRE